MAPVHENKRILSMSIFAPPSACRSLPASSASSLSSGSILPESFRATSVVEEADIVEIPAILESKETYVSMGFTEERAAELWQRYSRYGEEINGGFLDFAVWHVENDSPFYPDATSGSDDWDACMRDLDINDKLRAAILLPEFEDVRYTATCKFWLADAITAAYETLRGLNKRLRVESQRSQHYDKIASHKHAGSASPTPAVSSRTSKKAPEDLPPSISKGAAPLSPLLHHAAAVSEPVDEAVSAESPAALDDHTILWRAETRMKAEAFYDVRTQRIDMASISTVPEGFHGMERVAYSTPQEETADRYAQWLKHKIPASEIAIIQIAVPGTLLRSLNTQCLWYTPADDSWRKVIFNCRRSKRLSKELRYLERQDLLNGPIATGIHQKFLEIGSYKEISESDVLTIEVDGECKKAVQWVFNTHDAIDGFEDQCQGKVWIHSLGSYRVPKLS